MAEEKTLLQQIREKEQELALEVDTVKAETDGAITAARNEAEDLICTADKAGKTTAEQVYWKARGATAEEIADLKREAELARDTSGLQSERNLAPAVERIVRYVKGE
jgi:vacuolar-type H+-ATPase subunit H